MLAPKMTPQHIWYSHNVLKNYNKNPYCICIISIWINSYCFSTSQRTSPQSSAPQRLVSRLTIKITQNKVSNYSMRSSEIVIYARLWRMRRLGYAGRNGWRGAVGWWEGLLALASDAMVLPVFARLEPLDTSQPIVTRDNLMSGLHWEAISRRQI
jgi:hypothetical protein